MIKLLDRYIAKIILASIALVTFMLVGLQIFILFVNQLNDLGKEHYGFLQAAFFVLLQMPYQVYLFFPMASLLGSLVGLGILANHSELVVMRASGMSIGQITLVVLKAALLVVLVVTLAGETLVPKLAKYANSEKFQALHSEQMLRTAQGTWFRYQNNFIHVEKILSNDVLKKVDQFTFDESHRLQLARSIQEITYEQGAWQAHQISESIIGAKETKVNVYDKMAWEIPLNPKVLIGSTQSPDEMTLRELRQYFRAQKKNHQTAANYQMTYWERLLQPLTIIVMMVLAIPFIFGPLRTSTMGSKLLAGISVGFSFYILNRCFKPISQLLEWPPEVAAFTPPILFALLGLYLMRRAS